MNEKSIGLVILWWVETIVAIRVLLFTIPVILNKSSASNFILSGLDDRFILVITATALLFCVVGAASIMGYRYWKAIHFLAAIFTVILTVGSLSMFGQSEEAVNITYFIPIFVSVIFVAFAGVLGAGKQTA